MLYNKLDNDILAFNGTTAERREAAERERLRHAEERQKSIAAQSSPRYEPRQRIELWEHLHAMRLPRSADHQLVQVIAKQTALTVTQVQAEQARRVSNATNPADVQPVL